MTRVLLMPQAANGGLAHAGACHTLAAGLAARGHDVVLGYGGRWPDFVKPGGHRVVPVAEIDNSDPHQIDRWYPNAGALEAMVAADREVIEHEQPEVVISDARDCTPIAAADAGVPDISLYHFLGMTPWSEARRLSGQRWVRRARHPAMSFGRWWDARTRDLRPVVQYAELVESVRRAHGLEPSGFVMAGARMVACTSTPLLDSAPGMPDNWRHIGHLTWSAEGSAAELPVSGDRPLVYVSQGSSGRGEALIRAVRDLASLPVDVLVTTAELCDPSDLEQLAPNVTARRYLPGHACLERASVAVIHGGHLTASDAHLTGTPVVVVPAVADHWVWAARVQRLGTGIPVEGPLLAGRIRRAASRILADDAYRDRVRAISRQLASWDPCANVEMLIHELTGSPSARSATAH